MYLILETGTKNIVHKNMAPLSQKLTASETYFEYNADNHDFVITDNPNLPQYWKVVDVEEDFYGTGVETMYYIEPMTTQDKVDDAIITLEDTEKIVDNAIVDKTYTEQVNEDIITIETLRSDKLSELKTECQIRIGDITQTEQRAKTEWMVWVEAGQSGDAPDYWTDWKTSRDVIVGEYDTNKSWMEDGARTKSDLLDFVWS